MPLVIHYSSLLSSDRIVVILIAERRYVIVLQYYSNYTMLVFVLAAILTIVFVGYIINVLTTSSGSEFKGNSIEDFILRNKGNCHCIFIRLNSICIDTTFDALAVCNEISAYKSCSEYHSRLLSVLLQFVIFLVMLFGALQPLIDLEEMRLNNSAF